MSEVFATRHGLRAAFCTAPKGRAGWLGRAALVTGGISYEQPLKPRGANIGQQSGP
jgi:hypothetical protein